MKPLPERINLLRVALVKHTPQDAEEIFYSYASKEQVTEFLPWKTHESIDDTRAFLKIAIQTWKARTQFAYSVRMHDTGRLIGACGCLHTDGVFQIGYVFSPSVWGQGYATDVCSGLVQAIRENPAVRKITSFVDVENIRSMKVLERVGFVKAERAPEYFLAINQGGKKRDAWIYNFPLT